MFGETMLKILDHVSNLKIDVDYSGTSLDDVLINKYMERFEMLKADDVPKAFDAYFEKLLTEDTNEATKSYILNLGIKMRG